MIDISVQNITKEFAVGEPVLNGLSFQIQSGERVGILGKNGAGKTTLFHILTGEIEPDTGDVMIASNKKIGLISQIPIYPEDYTVLNVLETAFAHLNVIEKQLDEITAKMEDDSNNKVLQHYDALVQEYDVSGGYEKKVRLEKVCNGLGISEDMKQTMFARLSGGEKTRINLARLLLVDTDILLLDEPTNHLDLNATQWLEEYLLQYKGTVLTISHDRYFLDHVISRAIELVDGKADFYEGNYTFYAIEKEKRFLEKVRQYQKEQAKLDQLKKAADKLHLWAFMGNDKLHKRAFSIEKRMEKLQRTDKPKTQRKLKTKFEELSFSGDDFFYVEHLTKKFEDRTLFSDISLRIESGDYIALLGDNGTGKSTFIKILMEEILPTNGYIFKAPTLSIGYLPQQVVFTHPERTLLDTLLYELNCTSQLARDQLAAFHFRGEDVFKKVSNLSGGEKSRLRLCMLMTSKINFLLLDEPTNHLDLHSREWIEEAVEEFEGTVLFVSHDRYFIDRFANRIWTMKDGTIQDYIGDYKSYSAMLENKKDKPNVLATKKASKTKAKKETGGTKQLEKELNTSEKSLHKLEIDLEQLEVEKEKVSDDYVALQEIMEKEEILKDKYNALLELWEEIATKLEELNNEN